MPDVQAVTTSGCVMADADRPSRSRRGIAGWGLWRSPRHVLAYVLAVDAVAALGATATGFLRQVTGADLIRFGVLVVCAAVYIEFTRHVERRREYQRSASVAYIDTKAVWSFAAVLVLPPVLASATVIATYAIAWARIWPRSRPVPAYRWVFSCSTVLAGTQAAIAVLALANPHGPVVPIPTTWAGAGVLGVIAAAAVLRWAINVGLVMAAIAVSTPPARVGDLFANFSDQVLEAGSMALGIVAATLLVDDPIVLAAVVLAITALHRGVLLRQYRHAAHTDTKTGLLTAGWWHEQATQLLARARARGEGLGLLMLDLDHFKKINDTHGHLAGDVVLRAVADALAAETRPGDMACRWGGEEFAVLITGVGHEQALHSIAERCRRRIGSLIIEVNRDVRRPDAELRPGFFPESGAAVGTGEPQLISDLTVSVGGMLAAPGIADIDDLLRGADTQLYRAKTTGRDRTSIAPSAT